MKPFIQVQDADMVFNSRKGRFHALRGINLDVQRGEFISLIGHSGCGKSTLLNLIAGLLQPSEGALICDGREIAAPGPERAVVFQNHSLLPWLTCLENVLLAVESVFGRREPGVRLHLRARAALELVGMNHALHKRPHEISGGMKQRVGIARALAMEPKVLLMDEPFGALDALTRSRMQELLLDLWARMRTTVVFVTHDIDEALFLADRVLVIGPRPGRIVEEITLDFARPRSAALLTEPAFVQLKRRCLSLLREDAGAQALERLTPLGTPRWRFAT